jgi:hypothetical protein
MKELIEIFRMNELSVETRCRVIISLGKLINNTYGSNLTEEIVYELVKILDNKHKILTDNHYLGFVKFN